MEEGFFLDGITLHSAHVSPRHVQGPTTVVANFADTRLAVGDGTTMPARKTPHAVTVELLVQFGRGLAHVLINDFTQSRHAAAPPILCHFAHGRGAQRHWYVSAKLLQWLGAATGQRRSRLFASSAQGAARERYSSLRFSSAFPR